MYRYTFPYITRPFVRGEIVRHIRLLGLSRKIKGLTPNKIDTIIGKMIVDGLLLEDGR